eukprot:Opistho-1_new@47215
MSSADTIANHPTANRNRRRPPKLLPALLVAGSSMLAATSAQAQSASELERTNRELQAENARLKAALERAGIRPEAPPAPVQQAAASPAPAPVQSADNRGDAELGEAITVTALRLKEAPRSVSAVTGEELEKFHVNNFRDIANRIGNVRTSWNNPNTASIFVRGVGWAAGAGVLDPPCTLR